MDGIVCSHDRWRERESETLFPPYSAFMVVGVSAEGCHLLAVDIGEELEEHTSRNAKGKTLAKTLASKLR